MTQAITRVGRTPEAPKVRLPDFGKRGATAKQEQVGHPPSDSELWRRLEGMSLIETPMRRRLAKDNNWTASETERAIGEYRRFLYLSARAGHAVTPSRPVDKVWHEHLLHSKHYWETLCRDVLKQDLHHNPGNGQSDDEAKLQAQYGQTLDSYREAFGADAPADIWPRWSNRKPALWSGRLASLMFAGAAAGLVLKSVPLLAVCGIGFVFAAIAHYSRDSQRSQTGQSESRGGCGAGCGGGAIGATGCGDTSSSHSNSNSNSDTGSSDGGGSSCGGGGCGGGGD